MSIRGTVTLECDTKGCHAETVIMPETGDCLYCDGSLKVQLSATDWQLDCEGNLHCPQCCEEGRERGEDDGREYGHPADAKADRL
jgi:hypothetical protein